MPSRATMLYGRTPKELSDRIAQELQAHLECCGKEKARVRAHYCDRTSQYVGLVRSRRPLPGKSNKIESPIYEYDGYGLSQGQCSAIYDQVELRFQGYDIKANIKMTDRGEYHMSMKVFRP